MAYVIVYPRYGPFLAIYPFLSEHNEVTYSKPVYRETQKEISHSKPVYAPEHLEVPYIELIYAPQHKEIQYTREIYGPELTTGMIIYK